MGAKPESAPSMTTVPQGVFTLSIAAALIASF